MWPPRRARALKAVDAVSDAGVHIDRQPVTGRLTQNLLHRLPGDHQPGQCLLLSRQVLLQPLDLFPDSSIRFRAAISRRANSSSNEPIDRLHTAR